MTPHRILSLAVTGAFVLLASCGGHDGVELGDFPAIAKTEGDEPFKLTAPSSKSPAAFSFTSSDPAVATVAGDTVTVHIAGTSTITAQQGQLGSYYPTSKSTVLTVAARVCTAPAVRENGLCVAPPTTAGYVSASGLTWMPATVAVSWSVADNFCKNTTIKGATGWRLPTRSELDDLAASGMLSGQGWKLGDTWTATADSADNSHFVVNTGSRASSPFVNSNPAYVTCVRGV